MKFLPTVGEEIDGFYRGIFCRKWDRLALILVNIARARVGAADKERGVSGDVSLRQNPAITPVCEFDFECEGEIELAGLKKV